MADDAIPIFFVIAWVELEVLYTEEGAVYLVFSHVRLNATFSDMKKTASYSANLRRYFEAQIQLIQTLQSASFADLGESSFLAVKQFDPSPMRV